MAGRPAKSVNVSSKNLTIREKEIRKATEEKLKGNSKRILPPKYLSDDQKKIFSYIVKELKESNILGVLDVYVLSSASIAIDRLMSIENKINLMPEAMFDKDVLSAKDRYTKDFFRCCSELCLSPQSRAKLGTLNLQTVNESKDPLLKALMDDDD